MKKKCLVFGSGGSCMSWYHGYATFLQEEFNLDDLYFAGISAGCQPASFLGNKIPMDIAWNEWFIKLIYGFNDKLPNKNMFEISKFYLERIYFNRHIKINKKIALALTDCKCKHYNAKEFEDFEELWCGIKCTQFIPLLVSPKLFSKYKNKCFMDGYIAMRDIHKYKPFGSKIDYIYITLPKEISKKSLSGLRDCLTVEKLKYHEDLRKKGYEYAKNNEKELLRHGLKKKNIFNKFKEKFM